MEGIQGPYLKGYRDFMTGVLAGPGIYVRNDLYMYSGTENSRLPQGQLQLKFKGVIDILGVSVVTPYKFLGGNYAFAVRGAYSSIEADGTLVMPAPRPTVVRRGELDAFNDMAITPLILGWHSGNLHWNFSTTVWAPVGAYDRTRLANTGRNTWAWAPQFGVTYFDPASGWDVSGAASYIMSTKNDATNYQSGGLGHLDFAVGQVLSPNFKLGVVGYYVQQLTADSGLGAIAGDRKMRVAGLGPGASFGFAVNKVPVTLVAKFYREFAAQYATQGNAGTLSARLQF